MWYKFSLVIHDDSRLKSWQHAQRMAWQFAVFSSEEEVHRAAAVRNGTEQPIPNRGEIKIKNCPRIESVAPATPHFRSETRAAWDVVDDLRVSRLWRESGRHEPRSARFPPRIPVRHVADNTAAGVQQRTSHAHLPWVVQPACPSCVQYEQPADKLRLQHRSPSLPRHGRGRFGRGDEDGDKALPDNPPLPAASPVRIHSNTLTSFTEAAFFWRCGGYWDQIAASLAYDVPGRCMFHQLINMDELYMNLKMIGCVSVTSPRVPAGTSSPRRGHPRWVWRPFLEIMIGPLRSPVAARPLWPRGS